jgi:hypothetical protein
VAVGSTAVTFQDAQFSDPNSVAINLTTQDGSIRITGGLVGDVDGDCDVDIVDVMAVAGRWGVRRGDDAYDVRYDLNNDGIIDGADVTIVVSHWGETCPGAAGGLAKKHVTPHASGAGAAAALSISPSAQSVQAGTTFTTCVAIANVADLGGLELRLAYDPAIVYVDGATLGSLLTGAAPTYALIGPTVDNSRGSLSLGVYMSSSATSGRSGSGCVAVISLRAVRSGTTALSFSTATLTDHLGHVQQTTNSDGTITVTGTGNAFGIYLPIIVRAP